MSKSKGLIQLKDLRNRIVRFEKVRGANLASHTGNWRDHPENQARALAGVLREIGIADVLLCWVSERNGGKLTTFDGHLRKDMGPDVEWWCAITDLTDAEADYMLAVLDPLAGLAQADAGALDALLASVQSSESDVQQMLADLAKENGLYEPGEGDGSEGAGEDFLPARWAVVIECDNEQDQVALLERLSAEGLKCRALMS